MENLSAGGGARPDVPLLVVIGDGADLARAAAALRAGGWDIVDGWTTSTDTDAGTTVCAGIVETEADAAAATTAAVSGAGVVAQSPSMSEATARLYADLRRIGGARLLSGWPDTANGGLDMEGLTLLLLVAQGRSVADAAAAAHVSRRTAVRRLATVRDALGVSTLAEAIVQARSAGYLRIPPTGG